jgi:cell fate regulator YaaT (PSP1 superfamily)
LRGKLGTIVRRLDDDDVRRMESHRRQAAGAVRLFGEQSRARQLGIKPITAEYTFDGVAITLNYSVPERERAPDAAVLRDFAQALAGELDCRVELKQVGPRDEARLLGGLGRCGRTLCCSSWLPVFPEISMSMAKNQELPLNPAKVSGVCGRLLCCLSYENDQYRQMKAIMPKLGQSLETPVGQAQVISMHLMKELVTVRLDADDSEVTFRSDELNLGAQPARPAVVDPAPLAVPETLAGSMAATNGADGRAGSTGRRRRRRRGGRRGGSSDQSGTSGGGKG